MTLYKKLNCLLCTTVWVCNRGCHHFKMNESSIRTTVRKRTGNLSAATPAGVKTLCFFELHFYLVFKIEINIILSVNRSRLNNIFKLFYITQTFLTKYIFHYL